ncbi:MAG: hypothetical protein HDR03_10765 [Lachnospiraceae bacterium]|nr:hypothetical protein [Lachnospiraceae bacterium]
MKTYDLKELLDKAYSDGFTEKSIAIATGVSIELIDRYYNGTNIEQSEIQELGYLLDFLMEVYREDVAQDEYIRGIVQTLNYFFQISNKTIANYLDISMEEFEKLLQNPCEKVEYYRYSLKILHLFMSFVRDRKYSYD